MRYRNSARDTVQPTIRQLAKELGIAETVFIALLIAKKVLKKEGRKSVVINERYAHNTTAPNRTRIIIYRDKFPELGIKSPKVGNKICIKCLEEKSLNEFPYSIRNECRSCINKTARELRAEQKNMEFEVNPYFLKR